MDDDMVPVPDDLWQEANEHTSRGNFDKAIEIYKYILIRYGANNLANEYANACLGDILFMLGQTDLAEDHLRKALSYNPENPDYHRTLGVIYYTRYEWENAVKEYRVALEKEPWNREYLRALGEAVFNAGDKKTGLEYLTIKQIIHRLRNLGKIMSKRKVGLRGAAYGLGESRTLYFEA